MKVIVGKNATGKTKELIKLSLETGTPIFALTENKAASLREKALAYFEKPANIVTVSDIIDGNYTGDIYVDDVEKVCSMLLHRVLNTLTSNPELTIAAVTITEE